MSEYLKRLADRQAKGLLHTAAADESSNFTRGLKSSFKNLGTTGLAALGAATGNEGYLTDAQISQAEGRRYQGDTQDFTGIDSIESAGDWFGYQAGNAVGSMAQTLVGGGIGGAVGKQVAKKAGLAALERSMAAGLGEQAAAAAGRKAAGRAVLGGSAVGMAAPNYPQLMGENVLAIMDDRGGEATLEDGDVGAAAFTAVFQTGLDILPVISAARKLGLDDVAIDGFKSGVIKHALKSPTKLRQVGRELGTGMVQEGLTEGAQEALKLATLEYLNESKDHWNLEAFESLVNATMAGAAGGLVMGAGPAVAGAVRSDKPWFRAGEQDEALDAAVNPDAVVNPAESSAVADVSPVTTEQGVPDYATEPVDYSDYLGGKESGTAFGGDSSRSQYADYLDSTRVPVDGQDGGDDYLGLLGGTAGTVDGVQQGGRAELPDYQHFMQNAQKTGSQNAPYGQNDDAGMVLSPIDEIAPPDGAMVPYQHEGELMPRNIGNFGDYNDQSVVIDQAAHESAESPMNELPEPTAAQKEAGNYKKGHLNLLGLPLTIENPKGSVRKGIDESGKPWESVMRSHYGYVKGSLGADGDQVDVFLGEGAANPQLPVFVVDQIDPKTGEFDEHKVMIGFADEQAAKAGYLANYAEGWQGIGGMTAMPVGEFKAWVGSEAAKRPLSELGGGNESIPEVQPIPEGTSKVNRAFIEGSNARAIERHNNKGAATDGPVIPTRQDFDAATPENPIAMDYRDILTEYDRPLREQRATDLEAMKGQLAGLTDEQATKIVDEIAANPKSKAYRSKESGNLITPKKAKSNSASGVQWEEWGSDRDAAINYLKNKIKSKQSQLNASTNANVISAAYDEKSANEQKANAQNKQEGENDSAVVQLSPEGEVVGSAVDTSEFKPTHELPTGEQVVAHPDDEGVWVDAKGGEWESGEASVIVEASETNQAAYNDRTSKQKDASRVSIGSSDGVGARDGGRVSTEEGVGSGGVTDAAPTKAAQRRGADDGVSGERASNESATKPLMDAVGDQFASGKKAVVLSGADKLAMSKSLVAVGTMLVDKPGRLFLQKGLPEAKRIVFTDMVALAKLKAAPNKLKAYADKGIELVFVDPDGTADKGLFEVVC